MNITDMEQEQVSDIDDNHKGVQFVVIEERSDSVQMKETLPTERSILGHVDEDQFSKNCAGKNQAHTTEGFEPLTHVKTNVYSETSRCDYPQTIKLKANFTNSHDMDVLVKHPHTDSTDSLPGEICTSDTASEMTPKISRPKIASTKLQFLHFRSNFFEMVEELRIRRVRIECVYIP